jgi:hypothetical protein
MIQQVAPDLLTKGREGKTNEKILEFLTQKPMTAYQLSRESEKAYATIFDRLDDLKARGVIQEKGKTRAAKTRGELSLWGLSSYGLYLATQSLDLQTRIRALNECQLRLSKYWDIFWELYEFDLVKDRTLRHRFLRNWIASTEGISEILGTFGHTPLEGEAQALIAFRRMLDIGIILVQSEDDFALTKIGSLQQSANFVQALTYLAGIAIDHPRLRKLHDVIREVDGPLYSRIKSEAFERTAARLSRSVPEPIARKLAMTPFFRDYPLALMDLTDHHIVDSPVEDVILAATRDIKQAREWDRNSKKELKMATKNGKELTLQVINRPSIQKIVLETDRLSIVTSNPNVISREWIRQSNRVYVVDEKGQVHLQREKWRV